MYYVCFYAMTAVLSNCDSLYGLQNLNYLFFGLLQKTFANSKYKLLKNSRHIKKKQPPS